MSKKFISLVKHRNASELAAYFAALPKGKPLDKKDEMVLIENYLDAAVLSYIIRFRFSEDAEIAFLDKAPLHHRRTYINCYGLRPATQKLILDQGKDEICQDFIRMRRFEDVTYFLEHGSPAVIRAYLALNVLENDEQVLLLLHHKNSYLFKAYVDSGRFISETVQRAVIEERNISAFTALMYNFHRNFKKKARNLTLEQMIEKQTPDVMLAEDLQLLVLDNANRMFVELMLKTTPLAVAAQKLMFERNFDAEWFRLHVEHLYGVAGYRFAQAEEERLFKILASKNLDDCLTKFRQRDDVSFVRLASSDAVVKYIKDFWLSDDAQVALLARGNADLAKKLISRYSPEHGLCWQAEVKLVELYSPEVIKLYVSFHSMCGEGLAKLEQKSREVYDFYYTRHPF